MRLLKRKLERAKAKFILDPLSLMKRSSSPEHEEIELIVPKVQKKIQKTEAPSNSHSRGLSKPSYDVKSTKNIVKNYGRAISSFILSSLARPYLEDILSQSHSEIPVGDFIKYISERRDNLDCMERLKRILIISDDDSKEEASYKVIFKQIAEIFIKYFSVNWIFSGRLTYKQAHLDFRFKMLRRLKNPELFTYMKSFQKNI
jgi:hypothetical protein